MFSLNLPFFRSALEGIVFENPDLSIGQSVTDYEFRTAMRLALNAGGEKGVQRSLFWLRRIFTDSVTKSTPNYWDFDDTIDDPDSRTKLSRFTRF